MSCGVGHSRCSDLVLLWLWHRLAATAPIRSLVWEPPYAAIVALKRQKQKKIELISNEVLLDSTGNYIQSLGIESDGRQYEKNIYIHSV